MKSQGELDLAHASLHPMLAIVNSVGKTEVKKAAGTQRLADRERPIIIYAPNIRAGGGLTLLKALLGAVAPSRPLLAFLDARAKPDLAELPRLEVKWVHPGLLGRLRAELALRAEVTSADRVLCFHGLPPLLPLRAETSVYLQNRLLVDGSMLAGFSVRTRVRIRMERLILQWRRRRVGEYLVQTQSMLSATRDWLGRSDGGDETASVRVLPFAQIPERNRPRDAEAAYRWDFIYPASSEAHKNHMRLVEAWQILAERGEHPILALTLPAGELADKVLEQAQAKDLRIENLGVVSHARLLESYGHARALIFPSLTESFGLPLVEAGSMGIPIIAGELDYARDVCTPQETFDPTSAISIARSVQRFLGRPESVPRLLSPREALAAMTERRKDVPMPVNGCARSRRIVCTSIAWLWLLMILSAVVLASGLFPTAEKYLPDAGRFINGFRSLIYSEYVY